MEPIGPLMIEHRLIERMVSLIRHEHGRLAQINQANSSFIEHAIDFMQAYADRCHHGKEEDILFRKLTEKNVSAEHIAIMEGLVRDHAIARKTTKSLAEANARYVSGNTDALTDIARLLGELASMYPEHIAKEDKKFFPIAMGYLSDDEKRAMLDDFAAFDRGMIHEAYAKLVEKLERESASS